MWLKNEECLDPVVTWSPTIWDVKMSDGGGREPKEVLDCLYQYVLGEYQSIYADVIMPDDPHYWGNGDCL